jgi:hypothetical protein
LFNSSASKFGAAGAPGDPKTLANHGVRVDLSHAGAQFAGHTYIAEVAATDDSGQRADFAAAGTLEVTAP